jgi:hypothetical protein
LISLSMYKKTLFFVFASSSCFSVTITSVDTTVSCVENQVTCGCMLSTLPLDFSC